MTTTLPPFIIAGQWTDGQPAGAMGPRVHPYGRDARHLVRGRLVLVFPDAAAVAAYEAAEMTDATSSMDGTQ